MYCIDCGIAFFPDTERERCIDCQILFMQSDTTASEPLPGRVVHQDFVTGDGRPPSDFDERLAEGFAAMEGVA